MTKSRLFEVKFIILVKGVKLKDLSKEEREDTTVYTRRVSSKRNKRKAYKDIVSKINGAVNYKSFPGPVEVTILDIKDITIH